VWFNRLTIEEAAPAGVPFVYQNRGDAHERGLVLDFADEGLEGQPDEILVGDFPQLATLLPAGVVPDCDGTDVVPDAEIHHGVGRFVEDVTQLVSPVPPEALDPLRGEGTVNPRRDGPELGKALIEKLIY